MAGTFSGGQKIVGGKYLVQRRDGTVPPWPWFVLGAADKNAPAGLRGYANECEKNGLDPVYVADVRAVADKWEADLKAGVYEEGDPDAPRHRTDDPAIVAKMEQAKGT